MPHLSTIALVPDSSLVFCVILRPLYANHRGHCASWTFYSALGEMRGTLGVHLARIAAQFKLDIEDRLAAILPAKEDDSD